MTSPSQELMPKAWALEQPLEGLLYDLGLLPEQVEEFSRDWKAMQAILILRKELDRRTPDPSEGANWECKGHGLDIPYYAPDGTCPTCKPKGAEPVEIQANKDRANRECRTSYAPVTKDCPNKCIEGYYRPTPGATAIRCLIHNAEDPDVEKLVEALEEIDKVARGKQKAGYVKCWDITGIVGKALKARTGGKR